MKGNIKAIVLFSLLLGLGVVVVLPAARAQLNVEDELLSAQAEAEGSPEMTSHVAGACFDTGGVRGPDRNGMFAPHVTYAVGNEPWCVAIANLDGDGDGDLAVANYDGDNGVASDNVSILLNNGYGIFAAHVTYDVAIGPYCLATADLDGDGDADLAVVNVWSGTVSVLLNNGDGTFAADVTYATGTYPSYPKSIAIADLDGDGDADLAVAATGNDAVSILMNNGTGTFAPYVSYPLGVNTGPLSIAIAHLDGDEDEDLAVANYDADTVSILFNNGDGTFALDDSYPLGVDTGPRSVAIEDLNGDGDADLAVANTLSDNVSVLLNNGDGTFALDDSYPAGDAPFSVAIADLDFDGDADLAVANYGSNNVSILLNNGNGTFAAQDTYAAGNGPKSVAIADLDGDWAADLAVANFDSDNVSILLNQLAGDCNTNGIPDECDVDCGPPGGECDISGCGQSDDCNSNSVPDECDIASGTSSDIDGNGIPDECVTPTFFSTWTGGGDGTSWEVAANWDPARVPNNQPGGDPPEFYYATIGPGGPFTVNGPSEPVEVVTFDIGAESASNVLNVRHTFATTDATSVDSNGQIVLVGAVAPATSAILSGGVVTIADGGAIRTGGATGVSRVISAEVDNWGTITATSNLAIDITAPRLVNEPGGLLEAQSGAGLTISSAAVSQRGAISGGGTAAVAFTGAELANSNGAVITLTGATLGVPLGLWNQFGATVNGAGGQIDGDIVNEGDIVFQGDLTLNGDLTVLGTGVVTATGDFVITGTTQKFVVDGGTFQLTPGPTGSGALLGATMDVTNEGLVEVDGDMTLDLSGLVTVDAGGTYQGVGATSASLTADSVLITNTNSNGGRMLLTDTMSVTVNGDLILEHCGCPGAGRSCTPPVFDVPGGASVAVHGNFTIIGAVDIQILSSGAVTLGGNLFNQSTAPTVFDWGLGGLSLDGVAPQTFEVAGTDIGADINGLVDNFAMGELEVQTGADVEFVDQFDNDPWPQTFCSEALYVGTLVLRSGSTVDLDECRIYYGELIDEGVNVTMSGCGRLRSIVPGDVDGDRHADLDDYTVFTDCVAGPDAAPVPTTPTTAIECLGAFDFDGDGDVDLGDFGGFQEAFGGT